jgi:hypothetical protein
MEILFGNPIPKILQIYYLAFDNYQKRMLKTILLIILINIVYPERSNLLSNIVIKYNDIALKLNWSKEYYIRIIEDLSKTNKEDIALTYAYTALSNATTDSDFILFCLWISKDILIFRWIEKLEVSFLKSFTFLSILYREPSVLLDFSICPKLAPFLNSNELFIIRI